jgi:hypothetical protein
LKTILYTKDFNEKINEPVNVILSPHFYWIKKIEIPVKSLNEVKKLAKNIFKLDEKKYKFFALKINNDYYAIAIEKNLNIKIDKKYIKNIYIAQSELKDFNCININDKYTIKKIDNLLFCFPKKECKNDINQILQNIKLSKNKINIFNSIEINKKQFFLFKLSIFIIAVYFIIQGIEYKKEINNLQTENLNLLKENNLPKTTFQLNSILSNLENEFKKQQKIKKSLEIISSTPLKKNEYFLKITYNKFFILLIKTKRNLDFYFKKYFNINSKQKNGIYKVILK